MLVVAIYRSVLEILSHGYDSILSMNWDTKSDMPLQVCMANPYASRNHHSTSGKNMILYWVREKVESLLGINDNLRHLNLPWVDREGGSSSEGHGRCGWALHLLSSVLLLSIVMRASRHACISYPTFRSSCLYRGVEIYGGSRSDERA